VWVEWALESMVDLYSTAVTQVVPDAVTYDEAPLETVTADEGYVPGIF
jgi:hypothetical protein